MHRGARTALVLVAVAAVVAAGTGGVGAASGGQSDGVITGGTDAPAVSGDVAGLEGVATATVTGNWSGTATTVRVDDTNWTAGGAVRPLDDEYVMGGAAGAGPASRTATVWGLDASGEVVWTRTFGTAGANATVSALVPVGSGGDTVVVGTRHDGATGHDAFAARIGPDGAVDWRWQSDASGAQYGVDAVRTAAGDGTVLAVTDAGSDGRGDVALVELGDDGTAEWSAVDAVPGDQRAAAVATGDDGTGYLVGGTNRSVAPTDDRALFVRTTADGTVVDRTGASGDLLGVTRAVTDVRAVTDRGGYVGVGSVTATSTDAAVFEADETGITEAVRTGVDPLDERADAFAPRPTTGGSVVVGHQEDTAPGAGTAWVAGVAPDGHVDWRRTAVGGSNADVVTDGDRILVVGTRTDGSTGADAVVVALDPTGPDPFAAGVPGVGSGLAPTDPDDDGTYEDVDGDGTASYDDVVALAFADLTAIGADPVGATAFDFDGDGRVTYLDVIWLFRSIES